MQILSYHNEHNTSLDAVCFFSIAVGNIPPKKKKMRHYKKMKYPTII